jgi:hypothetical protein
MKRALTKFYNEFSYATAPKKKELESKAFNNVEFFYVVCTTNGKKYRAIDETEN